MNNKALLIGAAIAAYLLREQIAHALGMSDPAHTTTPATSTSSTSSTASTSTPAPGAWAQILTKAQAEPAYIANGGTMTTHEWNTDYQAVRNVAGPDPGSIGQGDGNRRITFEEYRAAMTAAGLSGLRAAPPAAPRPALTSQRFTRKAWSY